MIRQRLTRSFAYLFLFVTAPPALAGGIPSIDSDLALPGNLSGQYLITGGSTLDMGDFSADSGGDAVFTLDTGLTPYTITKGGGTLEHTGNGAVVSCDPGTDNVLTLTSTGGAVLTTLFSDTLIDMGDGADTLRFDLTATGMRGVLDGGAGDDTLVLAGTGRIATGDQGTGAISLAASDQGTHLLSSFEHLQKVGTQSWTLVGSATVDSKPFQISSLHASGYGELYVENDVNITGDCTVTGFDAGTTSATRFVVQGSLDVGGDLRIQEGGQIVVENGGNGVLSLAAGRHLSISSPTVHWDPGDQFPPNPPDAAGVTILIVGPDPFSNGPSTDRLDAAGAHIDIGGGVLLANGSIDNAGNIVVLHQGFMGVFGSVTADELYITEESVVAVYDPAGGDVGALTVGSLAVGSGKGGPGQLHVFGGLTATDDVWIDSTGTLVSVQGTYDNDYPDKTTFVLDGAQLDVQGTFQAYNLTIDRAVVNVAGDVQLNPAGVTTITDGELNVLTGGSLTGDADIQGGFTRINGTNTGDVALTGGELDGIGIIEGDLSQSGGTFAPGNSVGTLTINDGNYSLAAGATLEIEIDTDQGPMTFDKILVNDTDNSDDDGAAIVNGGTISVVTLGSGTIANGQTFAIIQTTDGITLSAEPTVTSNSAFVTFAGSVSGDTLDYVLTATRAATFVDVASGSNNGALGGALDAMDAGTPSADQGAMLAQLQAMNAAQFNEAVKQLDANPHIHGMQTGVSGTQTVNNHLAGRTSAVRSGSAARAMLELRSSGATGLQFANADLDPALLAMAVAGVPQDDRMLPAQRWQAWVRGFGVFDRQDSTSERVGFAANTGGVMAGLDRRVSDNALLGALVSYSYTDLSYDQNRGDADAHTLRVGPYASCWFDNLFVDASLTFGYYFHESDRKATIGALQYAPTADYDAWDLSAYAGVGYEIELGNWIVTPSAALMYSYYDQEAFDETGGGPTNQSVQAWDSDSLRSRLSIGVSRVVEAGDLAVMLEGSVGWSHEFLDPDPITARFIGETTSFAFDAGSHGEDAVVFGAGATFLVETTKSVFVRYDGEAHGDGQTHAISVGAKFNF